MDKFKEPMKIRPSQVTRTFGPGAIYDNERDSVIIMGLDSWDQEKFKKIVDPVLLMAITSDNAFKEVDELVSTSSFMDPDKPGKIPIRSFPTWGFCPVCNKLVGGRRGPNKNMHCDSDECKKAEKESATKIPRTYPVRYVIACKNGHLDDFPWYDWVHSSAGKECSNKDARLYLEDSENTLSLSSKSVSCKNCGRRKNLASAMTEEGLKSAKIFECKKTVPWLKGRDLKCVDKITGKNVMMRGMFKGASNMYFPLVKSAVTIPPFSDELSVLVCEKNEMIKVMINSMEGKPLFDALNGVFEDRLKEEDDDPKEKGRWTLDEVLKKRESIKKFQKRKDRDIYKIEFEQLDSGEQRDDAEFTTKYIKISEADDPIAKFIDKIALVEKCRVVSAITGFTRMEPFEGVDKSSIARIATGGNYKWFPVIENRGEGIFLSFKNEMINKWYNGNDKIEERMKKILTHQGQTETKSVTNNHHNPKYVFLHTFSHAIIKGLGIKAGYDIASFSERIYCDDNMAGIFIFTSSASSDGSLGGLTEIGRRQSSGINRIWSLLRAAVDHSTKCSCDPLCSMQNPEKTQNETGSACHACTYLPETSCERMNLLLDRSMISHTLQDNHGFLKDTY
ncbi:DUF1998 domain-containing protein [Candidatus Nitrosopelagicus sp.]|nr:DUF1998 domain-containing protein [Candidatus Nitrosopelagicus sp.]